jgi:hypothetical protein
MSENKYAPPLADFSSGGQHKRPIPVYLIAALCTFQVAALLYIVSSGWPQIWSAISIGAVSPITFAAGFLFPSLHFVSGMLLFFMRKAGAYGFGFYFVWSVVRLFINDRLPTTLFDFSLTTAIAAYSIWLYRRGLLK